MDRPVKAVIFDLDGVLVRTDRYHCLAWQQLAADNGWQFDEKLNCQLRGIPRMASLEVILQYNRLELAEDEKEKLSASKNCYFQKAISDISRRDMLPGAISFINELRAEELKLAICSSSQNALMIVEQLGLTDLFEVIITGLDPVLPKPHPDIFLKAAQLLNEPPERCVVFEDAAAGVKAALAAGTKCIGVGECQQLSGAFMVIRDFKQSLPFKLWSCQK